MVARRVRGCLAALALAVAALWFAAAPAAAEEQWQQVSDSIVALLEQIPDQYAAGDVKAVESTVREAYYEQYQVSGLEDDIKHRLGADRASAFRENLISLRNLARTDVPSSRIEQGVAALVAQLRTDVDDVNAAPQVTDRWAQVAQSIVDTANGALRLYQAGDRDTALSEASRAYLEHYEAGGLEKATLSYLSSGRVAQVEAAFRALRVDIRDGAQTELVSADAAALAALVTEDAKALDALGANESLGWTGFLASFLILLREGAEALLVVAAVVTYVVKTGRREQLRGVYLGIAAAVAVSAGLAVLFSALTTSAALGMVQELLEGVTGLLAAAMLIYISSWILSKSEGDAWQRYIGETVEGKSGGGRWALFAVVFLAVAREGCETILFYVPVFGAAQTPTDHLLVWAGLVAAALALAVLFIAVRVFGVRLPLRPFFRWTSVFMALLAVTITGGAVKEFQDAMLVGSTPVDGVPEITWLGLYPTVESLAAQAAVTVLLVGLMVTQFRRSASRRASGEESPTPVDETESPTPTTIPTKG
ncbi:FTR1 family iron permease [Propionicimonas sp.]|uniref:FTR1 family iron permease n=1 Tax=Propionicimonas sp. TaxID=1955623 RepID=UPI0039E467A1